MTHQPSRRLDGGARDDDAWWRDDMLSTGHRDGRILKLLHPEIKH